MNGWWIAHLVWTYVGDLAAAACGVFAFWRGGPPEKGGAAILLAGWVLSALAVYLHVDYVAHGVRYVLMGLDVLGLVGFVALSLWSRRLWTVFMAAFQLNDVMTHVAAYWPGMDNYTYVTAIGFWGGWGLVFTLAFGVTDHIRREKKAAGG